MSLGGCGGEPTAAKCAEPCIDILFIGNSHAKTNDLPAEFARLAASGGQNVSFEMLARGASTLPALEQLNQMIRQTGAQPVLFATAGWLDGLPAAGLTDFHQLQTAINAGYDMAASRLGAPVAPVGAAWQRALTEGYGERMWGADRLHASPLGTLPYTGQIAPMDAAAMQRIAAASVALPPVRE